MSYMQKIRHLIGHVNPADEELKFLIEHGLKIGKNSYINGGCTIDSGWPWLISIGDNVTVSSNVTILAHDASSNVVGCGTKLGRVTIGNNVFIGTGSIVLCNTRIGNNVVVGAGSLVTGDIPSNTVVAGRPAKLICSIEEYQEKMLKQREMRPNYAEIHAWNEWREAPNEEKEKMIAELDEGIGFV